MTWMNWMAARARLQPPRREPSPLEQLLGVSLAPDRPRPPVFAATSAMAPREMLGAITPAGSPEQDDVNKSIARTAETSGPPMLAQASPSASAAPTTGLPRTARSALSRGRRHVEIEFDDGGMEARTGGTRSWRNNNPGNLHYDKQDDARANGAVGFDVNGDAIFPNYEVGRRAAIANLRSRKYQAKTINEAVESWAPSKDNPTAGYQRFVERRTGLSGNTPLHTLTPAQLERVYEAIKTFEGWREGEVWPGPP